METELQRLIDDLAEYIEVMQPVDTTCMESPESRKIPHKGGVNSPYHIYTTTNSSPVTCTPDGNERTDAYAPDATHSEPANAGKRLENKSVSQSPPVNWTIAQLSNAATDLFRSCIDTRTSGTDHPTSETIVDAAADMASMLGINHSAWAEACSVMGRFDAALAVLVLDRNRNHPTHPVRSPGGALRAMTDRARSGDLNIDASIFAILRRSDDETDRMN